MNKRWMAAATLALSACSTTQERAPSEAAEPPKVAVETWVKKREVRRHFSGDVQPDNTLVPKKEKEMAYALFQKNRCYANLLGSLNQAAKHEHTRVNTPDGDLRISQWTIKVEVADPGTLDEAVVTAIAVRPTLEGKDNYRPYEFTRKLGAKNSVQHRESGFDAGTAANNQGLSEFRDGSSEHRGDLCSVSVESLKKFVKAVVEDVELSIDERELDPDVMNSAI